MAYGFPGCHLAEKGTPRAGKSPFREAGSGAGEQTAASGEIPAACPALGLLRCHTGGYVGCQLAGDTCSASLNPLCSASLPAAHIHLCLPKTEIWCLRSRAGTGRARNPGMLDPSWQLGGKTPPDLLPIPGAATETHPNPGHTTSLVRSCCSSTLKKLPSKSPLLNTDTPNLALWLLPDLQAANPQRAGSTPRHPLPTGMLQPGTCGVLPAAGIPQGNGMGGGNGIRAPPGKPAAPAVGPCPTLWDWEGLSRDPGLPWEGCQH